MKYILPALAAVASLFLSSCGTTSSLEDTGGNVVAGTQRFSKIVVQNYTSSVDDDDGGAKVAASGFFPDHIVKQLHDQDKPLAVSRNAKPDADTLVIDGVITRYNEGNAALRLFVGMGAGSSYFDATTRFKDYKGNVVGQIVTDKNSWALGGGLAASQTTQKFMENAAEKIAAEAYKLMK